MKHFFLQYIILAVVVPFLWNCSSGKKRSADVVLQPTILPTKTEGYKDITKEGFSLFEDVPTEKKWVDSVYNSLSFEEKLGQLFMVAAYSNKDSIHFKAIDSLIVKNKIGGLIFFQGGPVRQSRLTNRFQAESKIPLFIGNDAEWGLSMRLDSTYKYPWNMTLGAIQDMKLIEDLGAQMGKEVKRMGIQFNFAPVLDINTNPNNPIIGNRSFGENKEEVTRHAIALMKGIQNQGVFATGKHFPGHGDTETDSHKGLPKVGFSEERLNEVEFFPYKKMFDLGLASVMVAHLNVPSLEKAEGTPSSISYNVVTNILKKQLGFKGLIFTDALNMKGASNFKKPGEIDLAAFQAGNDIMLFAEDVPSAIEKFKQAYKDTLITDERIEHSVKKILKYKYKAGLNQYKPIALKNITTDINTPYSGTLLYKLYENAITVVKNEKEVVPINNLAKEKIAYIKIGDDSGAKFLATLNKYSDVTQLTNENLDSLNSDLKKYTKVIIGYHVSDKSWWKNPELTAKELLLIEKVAEKNQVILTVFAKPYVLKPVTVFDKLNSIVIAYQNGEVAQEVAAELIFGAISAKGKLPVSINENYQQGLGLATKKIDILSFGTPESVGLDSQKLKEIDQITTKAITDKIAPGAQILIARRGKVVYQKSFGTHSYEDNLKVKNSDLFDIASVSKIVGTLPSVMIDYDKGKINLETHLGDMVHKARGTNKDSITFKALLSHYARLQAWEPFYKSTLDSVTKKPLKKYYQTFETKDFPSQVAENLFIKKGYNDSIIKFIVNSKLLPKKEYKYSDFTFILLKEYLETHHHKSLDVLAEENFFSKLGMNRTSYNPLQKFDEDEIIPTEKDNYFRYQMLQGYVHDMGAAMQGGVGGHAGVFSNAMDLAKIMQLFLQKGNYGGNQFFSAKTMDDFNTCYYCPDGNRRGIGFDKPQLGKEGPTCGCASITSFGHTGFTGTMVWADPEKELIYIFLSNRTYPDGNAPNKLSKENIREKIQQVIYDALLN